MLSLCTTGVCQALRGSVSSTKEADAATICLTSPPQPSYGKTYPQEVLVRNTIARSNVGGP